MGRKKSLLNEADTTKENIKSNVSVLSTEELQYFFESTLNALPSNIVVVDATGEIIFTNKIYKDFAEHHDIASNLVSEKSNYLRVCDSVKAIDSDYAHDFAKGLRDVLRGVRSSFEMSYPYQLSDSQKWYVVQVTPLIIKDVSFAIITYNNITELKQSEQSLQKFKNTLDRTLDCVFIMDRDELRFNYVNSGAINLLGYSQDELLTMHPWNIKPEFSETQFRKLIKPALKREGGSLTFETIYKHKNGTTIFVEVILQFLTEEDYKGQIVAIVRDINERKKSQKQLELLSSVASQTTNSVIITDLAGRITWVNDGFLRWTGYTFEEVVGQKPATILQGPETDSGKISEMRTAIKNRQEFKVDVINYNKEKSPYWVRIACNVLVNENKEATGFIAIQSNINHEKQQEILLRERADLTKKQRNLYVKLSSNGSTLNECFNEQLIDIATELGFLLHPDVVSIWMFSLDNLQLQRQYLYDVSNTVDTRIAVLNTNDISSYLAALKLEGQIDATDAQNDSRIKELPVDYFSPSQIRSSLHTAIKYDGCLVGVICIEHCDDIREWQDDEKTFLNAIASLIAQYFANTKRIKAEAEVKEAQNLKNVTFDTVVDGIVTADQHGIIQTCNSALEKMFGYSKGGLHGKNIKVLMPDAVAKSHDVYMKAYEHNKLLFTIMGNARDLTAKRFDGHVFPVEIVVQETEYLSEKIYVASFRDISERKVQQTRIEKLAYYDSLTGLPNQRLLEQRFYDFISKKSHPLTCNALLLIDIDNFKHINHSMGHRTGDIILIEAARRISHCLSTETDMVARFGGDEFFVVLFELGTSKQIAVQQAELVAARIIQEIKKPYNVDGERLRVSASIGVSVEFSEEMDINVCMKEAEMAISETNKMGKNRVCLFDSQMESKLLWRLKIQADLALAIEQEELTVHYQPIVDSSGCIVKLEALVRWQHPTKGWVGPDLFIPIAEASQLIMPLGRQVLNIVLKDMEDWLTVASDIKWGVAVNISQFQLAYPNFQAQVKQILSGFSFAYGRLSFEVTESALAEDVESCITIMQGLAIHGITFSLDDFGTGYSSLDYLKRLPIEELKIDRSFVNNIQADQKDLAIIKSVCTLAREMGLRVVAEGVENAKQFQILKDLKCDHFQGYYFSKPRPSVEIKKLLGRGSLFSLEP